MNALATTLKQLRLSGLSQTLDVRLQEAAANRLSHAEFLELICQDELNVRQQRLMERHTKLADFRHLKTLDDFDWSFNPSVHKKEIYDLATCRFIREAKDVLFLGPPGVGKTHLAQAIGYEAIRHGRAQIMVTGGAEEMHFLHAAVFDLMMATSNNYNNRPHETPRPFDAKRDGLVVGEGAGCLVLEEYEHARRRGARIYAEVLGYWTNTSGKHLTDSDADSMEECMRAALKDAGISPEAVEHINAHATATISGDEAEARAIYRVYGPQVPVTALKGYTGHTLGASGAVEAIAGILMGREGFMAHTLNLTDPDKAFPPLRHVMTEPLDESFSLGVSNNFAFGGVNTSLVLRIPQPE